jgi:hypothetical protein
VAYYAIAGIRAGTRHEVDALGNAVRLGGRAPHGPPYSAIKVEVQLTVSVSSA